MTPCFFLFFFFQAEDGIRDGRVTGVQTCALPILGALPKGSARVDCGPLRPNELAVAMVEGWRGEIVHVVITDDTGRVRRHKVTDPSFHNWTALGLAMPGNEISDFPLCNKSFNLSYAGHDL